MTQAPSGSDTPLCSVVIATWNTRALVADALTSLFQSAYANPLEVIVVDNGSADGTAEMIRAKFPAVVLLREERNTGYARANNAGIRAAHGRFVLLLGSDAVVSDDTIRVMSGFLEDHPDVTAAACRLMNADGTPQMSCRRFPRLRDAVATYLSLYGLTSRYTMKDFDFYRTQEVEQPAATCLLIRREALLRLGGFDETYTILYNDVDLCKRIAGDGGRIFYVAETEVVHHGSSTTKAAPPELRLEMYRNILRYFTRHRGALARWVLTPILIARLLAATRSVRAFRLLTLNSEGWSA